MRVKRAECLSNGELEDSLRTALLCQRNPRGLAGRLKEVGSQYSQVQLDAPVMVLANLGAFDLRSLDISAKILGGGAIYSAYKGLHSEASWVKEAGPKAHFYWWVLTGLTVTATIVATILIPPFKSETLPGAVKVIGPFALAVVLVVCSIFIVAYGLSAVGHYLK